MDDRLDLPERYRCEVGRILSTTIPSMEVWAYGSRVNGTAHEASDLDLVLRAPGLAPISASRIEAVRESFRESNIPIIVDIHDWSRIPESFRQEILSGHMTLRSTDADATVITADNIDV